MHLTPLTADPDVARSWFERFEGAGLDGVVAKPADLAYLPGQRAMWKVKHERTGDFVVAGFRWYQANPEVVGSLMLGLYEGAHLQHVGVIGAFPAAQRRRLVDELAPYRDPRRPSVGRLGRLGGRRRWPTAGASPAPAAAGTPARTSASSCSAPTWSSRPPTSTCRASGCATPPGSAAGVPIGIHVAAPTTRWMSPSHRCFPRSSVPRVVSAG